MEIAFAFAFAFAVHVLFVGGVEVFFPVETVPAREQVVLDPNYFSEGFCEGDFLAEVETWVREDGFEEGVLDVG